MTKCANFCLTMKRLCYTTKGNDGRGRGERMYKDSKTSYHKAKVFPFFPTGEYYFHRGIRAFNSFDMDKAKKYLKRAMELEPTEPMIACQYAIILTETLEYEQSNEILLTILSNIDEGMTECNYFIANNFAHLGEFSEAYRYAHAYLSKCPQGEFAENAQDLLDMVAIEQDEEFLELEEQDELVSEQDVVREFLDAGQYYEAIEVLEETIKIHPEYWPAYNNLSLAYFYIGETGKAEGILEKVLESNPGNLHALCNQVIFLHYQEKFVQCEQLLDALEKVRPILIDHQYKLGSTLAFGERYQMAFTWLRKVGRMGYDQEPNYYYWLARSAYFTRHYQVGERAWKQLAELDPQRAAIAPWEDESELIQTDENTEYVLMMTSERFEERMYGLYLISQNERSEDILLKSDLNKYDLLTVDEKQYISFIIGGKHEQVITYSHQIAQLLNERSLSLQLECKDVLIYWFLLFKKIEKQKIKNVPAIASAVEYMYCAEMGQNKTRIELAKAYNISVSTVSKYIALLKDDVK